MTPSVAQEAPPAAWAPSAANVQKVRAAIQAGSSAVAFLETSDFERTPLELRRAALSALRAPPTTTTPEPESDWPRQRAQQLFDSAQRDSPLDFDRLYYSLDLRTLEMVLGSSFEKIQRTARHNLESTTPGDWNAFDAFLDRVTLSTSSTGNSIDFFIDGAASSARLGADIDSAKSSIDISVYQLQADGVGNAFADKLIAKAKDGVEVRLILDENGTQGRRGDGSEALIRRLRAGGVLVTVVPPGLMNGHLDHRKTAVIDNRIGYVSGMNIGGLAMEWHDESSRIEGPAVADVKTAFVDQWVKQGGARNVSDTAPVSSARHGPGYGSTRVLVHHGNFADAYIKAAYLKAIATSQNEIRIANPYFTDDDIADALLSARKRGVRVMLIMPAINDVPIVQQAARGFYPRLIKGGVELYEYQGRMAHHKVATFDGTVAMSGSSNLDARSLSYNDELNLVVRDAAHTRDINARLFDVDLTKSKRIEAYEPTTFERLVHLFRNFM